MAPVAPSLPGGPPLPALPRSQPRHSLSREDPHASSAPCRAGLGQPPDEKAPSRLLSRALLPPGCLDRCPLQGTEAPAEPPAGSGQGQGRPAQPPASCGALQLPQACLLIWAVQSRPVPPPSQSSTCAEFPPCALTSHAGVLCCPQRGAGGGWPCVLCSTFSVPGLLLVAN